MRRFSFRAGAATTHVVVGAGAFQGLARALPALAPGRWFVVSSRPVFDLHGARLLGGAGAALSPEPLLVPDGERAKTWGALGRVLNELVGRGLRRDGGLLALGGGTVGDLAGLAASLVLRGVPVVQAPTTLLAASDSALGGKTAVNLAAGKNLAGTIHQPRLVVVDLATLETLPDRAYRSGLAEVVKSSFLDAGFDRRMGPLEGRLLRRDPAALAEAVFRSLRLKARYVGKDPLETSGVRFALNLGHTVGHALETASSHRLQHGEAVGWGLLAALELSARDAGLSTRALEERRRRVVSLVSPPRLDARTLAGWASKLGADKKADRTGLRAVLLAAPGRPIVAPTSEEAIAWAVSEALRGYNPS